MTSEKSPISSCERLDSLGCGSGRSRVAQRCGVHVARSRLQSQLSLGGCGATNSTVRVKMSYVEPFVEIVWGAWGRADQGRSACRQQEAEPSSVVQVL